MGLLEYMTLRALDLDNVFVDRLREGGLNDLAIQEATKAGLNYKLLTQLANAFESPVPDSLQ